MKNKARQRAAGLHLELRPELHLGLISDTHGLLRPQALAALEGCDLIIHAGDVGKPEIVDALRRIAPTVAVRGNIDTDHWAADLPETETVEVGQLRFFVLHDVGQLALDAAHAGFAAVVFGHSHKPVIEHRGGVLFLNPGSAGPRRFSLPVTVGRARVSGALINPEIVHLPV